MTETSSRIIAGGSSGQTCGTAGPYTCSTHTDTVLFVRDGKAFPNCPVSKSKKGHSTTWVLSNEEITKPPSSKDTLDSVAL
jgi:hypothetical protein